MARVAGKSYVTILTNVIRDGRLPNGVCRLRKRRQDKRAESGSIAR